MKTIKNVETGEVKRVQEKLAYGSAPKGWEYCGKEEYKASEKVAKKSKAAVKKEKASKKKADKKSEEV